MRVVVVLLKKMKLLKLRTFISHHRIKFILHKNVASLKFYLELNNNNNNNETSIHTIFNNINVSK